MSDITTVWDISNSRGDWQIAGADLLSGNDLVTAAYISLFTDRVANVDDVIPDGSGDPRGWWGDAGETYPIGSRLWLLSREKQRTVVLQDAQAYVAEALQWMLDDGVVASFDVIVSFPVFQMLAINVVAYRSDGTTVPMQFEWAWKPVAAMVQVSPGLPAGTILAGSGAPLLSETGTPLQQG